MQGCSDSKIEVILLSLGIIHMLIEYVLGKRAAKKGGPGSLIALIIYVVIAAFAIIAAWLNRRKK